MLIPQPHAPTTKNAIIITIVVVVVVVVTTGTPSQIAHLTNKGRGNTHTKSAR